MNAHDLDPAGRPLAARALVGFRLAPRPTRLALLVGLLGLGLLAGLRLAFLCVFVGSAPPCTAAEALLALGIGLRFDVRLVVALTAPFFVAAWVPRLDPSRSRRARAGWLAALGLLWAPVVFLHLVDFAHYDYWHARLDANVLENLLAPDIAARAVWQSFPVGWGVLGLGLTVSGLLWAADRIALREATVATWPGSTRLRAALAIAGVLLAAAGAYGKLSWYPLRWSDAYFSPNAFLAALGTNPVLHVVDTWNVRGDGYDVEAVREHYPEIAARLGVTEPDPRTLTFRREVAARPIEGRPPNIVFVFLESLAAFKMGRFGNSAWPPSTPRLDALAEESVFFTRFFSACSPTARSVFSTLTGIADVNEPHSASRNPFAVQQNVLADAFDGWDKMYFLGGSASWGNIRGVLTHNIRGIEIHEEGSYDAPVNDVWGISDLDLVREAHEVFRRRTSGRPFIAFIQTAGNHRPWTIPEDHGDLEIVDGDPAALALAGFDEGVPELNAIRFLDHAAGELIALARTEPYYRDTVFFLFADHGTWAMGDGPFARLGLTRNHVPLIIHGPRRLVGEPRVVEEVASSLDLLPTAAGIAGIPYVNTTLGRDIFEARPPGERFAFVRIPPRVGVVTHDRYLAIEPDGRPCLYRYAEGASAEDVGDAEPETRERLERLTRGLHETARWMLRNNRPDAPE